MSDPYDDDDELSLMDSQDGLGGSSPRTARSARSDPEGGHSSGAGPSRHGAAASSSAAHLASRPRLSVGSFRAFLLSSALAELFATGFLTYLGLAAIYASNGVGDDALRSGSLLFVALGYGFSYGCLVYSFSLNGGGYLPSIRQMNPTVTLGLYLVGKIDAIKGIVLVIAQLLGTLFGTLLLIFSFSGSNLRTFELFDGPNVLQKMIMSILLSFLSTFVLLITNFAVVQPTLQQAVSTDSSEQAPQTVHELNSLISALVSVIGVAVGTPLSGCFMNPFFALALLSVSHWRHSAVVVIFGPTIGAGFAALAAKLFTYRTRAPFLTGVRWAAGGMGGLGLGNLQPQALATFADSRLGGGGSAAGSSATASGTAGSTLGAGGSYGQQSAARSNPFNPAEEKQGSRF